MSEVLDITLNDLLEIDHGRGITFKIYVLPDIPHMTLVIELMLGDYCYGRAISLMEARATRGELKDYVLGHFGKEEREKEEQAFERACTAAVMLMQDKADEAMNLFNRKVVEE